MPVPTAAPMHNEDCVSRTHWIVACTAAAALLLLAGCAPPPPKASMQPKPDPAQEAGYRQAVEQLAALNRSGEESFQRRRFQQAASAIGEGLPLQARLLTAPRPPLAAMEAVSDLDDLYARMLLHDGREGWARMVYQKNVARWRSWKPQDAGTARRLKQAQAGIAECDRRIEQ
jgi:hypothetical protein